MAVWWPKLLRIFSRCKPMARVLITTESRFRVSRQVLREVVEKFLAEQKIKSKVEVSIAMVGDRKMRALNEQYRNLKETTPVLSFSQEDPPAGGQGGRFFRTPPDSILRLGDIVISYPQAVLMSAQENKLVDQKIGELVRHGLANLFGISSW